MSELIDTFAMGEGQGQDIKNICFALVEIMVAKNPDMKPWKEKFESGNLIFEVDLKIDGVPVNFSTIIKHLFDQYEQQLQKSVMEEIGNKFQNLQIEMTSVMDQLKEKYGVY